MAAQARAPGNNGPRVFMTMGHGCDVIPDQIPGQPPVELPEYRVPAGCTFVTVEVCGRYSTTYELEKLFIAFQDPLWKEALKYPDNDKIWKVLHEYLQIKLDDDQSVLRVRTEGDIFTNPYIELWGDANNLIFQSGIYELGNIHPARNGGIRPMTELRKTSHELEISKVRKLQPSDLSADKIEKLYDDSIFPTIAEVIGGMPITYRYLDLMNSTPGPGPGVYYHFACRSPCDLEDYRPEVNYNALATDAMAHAKEYDPSRSFNESIAMTQARMRTMAYARKQPVIKRMRQRSINQTRQQMRFGQRGPDEKNLVQKGLDTDVSIDNWKKYINDADRRRKWIFRVFFELIKIVPAHRHPLILKTRDRDMMIKCALCGQRGITRTYSCEQDNYHECEGCQQFRSLDLEIKNKLANEKANEKERRRDQPGSALNILADKRAWYQQLYNLAPWRGSGRTKCKTYRKKANRRTRKRTHKRK